MSVLGSLRTARARRGALMLVAATLLGGCAPAQSRQPLPDWSAGYDKSAAMPGEPAIAQSMAVQFGRHSDLPQDGMGVAISSDVTWPMRIRKLDSVATPCAVSGAQDGKPHQIDCVIDMDELDLYVLGVKFDIVVPEGMCDFTLREWYMYENFEIGDGPTEVSWTTHTDGSVTDEINARDGKPFCRYDYRTQFAPTAHAPNCCLGAYTQTVTNADTGSHVTTHAFWNGRPGDCYDGAAYLDEEAKITEDGFPEGIYTYLGRTAWLKTVKFKGLSEHYGANVPLASFYRPTEHGGDMPAALKATFARPRYELSCEDDAKEEIAHISLTVREWNEEAQFDADRDPDTTGTEPGWNTPIDDIPDWDVLTPDDTSYPMLRRSM